MEPNTVTPMSPVIIPYPDPNSFCNLTIQIMISLVKHLYPFWGSSIVYSLLDIGNPSLIIHNIENTEYKRNQFFSNSKHAKPLRSRAGKVFCWAKSSW